MRMPGISASPARSLSANRWLRASIAPMPICRSHATATPMPARVGRSNVPSSSYREAVGPGGVVTVPKRSWNSCRTYSTPVPDGASNHLCMLAAYRSQSYAVTSTGTRPIACAPSMAMIRPCSRPRRHIASIG